MNSLKQSIFDWYRQNEKELKKSHASAFINCNAGTITLKYPDGFSWELPPEKARALQDEMRFACNRVSVFPVMEEVLAVMEA